VLDITGGYGSPEIYASNGGNNQQYTFTATGGGYYYISPVNLSAGFCIEVAGSSLSSNWACDVWITNGGFNQQWLLQSPNAPTISSATTTNGPVGTAFSYTITATGSPTGYNATGLPSGLNVNTGTGIITGTPTTNGTFLVTISATNSSGTGAAILTLTIYASGPPTMIWSGAVNTSWDTTTANWLTNGVSATYQDGNAVLFDDAALSNTTVTVSAPVSPMSVVVSNSTKSYTISGSAIAGTNNLIKLGSGTLTLSGANTFNGGVTNNGGTIILAASTSGSAGGVTAGPVGTGTINLRGGALSVDNGAARTIANAIAITTGTTNIFGSSVASQNFTLNGALSGGGTLQNQSVGPAASYTLYLLGNLSQFTGTITYTGAASGNGENWRVGTSSGTSDLSQAAVVLNGGNARNFGFQDNQNAVTLELGSLSGNGYFQGAYGGSAADSVLVGYLNTTKTFSGQLGVSGNNMANFSLTKVGTGTLLLTGTNIYTGQTTVSNGELVVSTVFAGKGNFVVTTGAALGVTNLSTGSAVVSNLTAAAGTTLEFLNVTNTTTPLMVASNLILNGSCTVKITGTNNLAVGNTYPLVNYSGNLTGSFANFQLQMPDGLAGALVNYPHQVAVRVISITSPTLSAAVSDGQLQLNWPQDHTGWTLQTQTNSLDTGLGTNWVDVTNLIFTNQLIIPLDSANGSSFFRLKYP
jgi:autotransporter-associated beta strand protein